MDERFAELTGSPSLYRRQPDRGILRATGSDRTRFLNGMLSNDVASLETGQACYATQLDRKGHVVADLWALALEDAFLLDTAPGRGGVILELLEKHIIADDVEFEDLSAAWGRIDFEGPEARAACGAPALEPNAVATGRADGAEWLWVGGGGLSADGVRALGPREALEALIERAGLDELSSEHAEILRIERFLPAYGVDLGERSFPAEARLDHALSFTKGCYIGQEIVARIDSRGAVNRLLVQLHAAAPVEPGAKITARGRPVGSVTSAAVSPSQGALALGYVKSELAVPGTALQIGDITATVAGPPLEAKS